MLFQLPAWIGGSGGTTMVHVPLVSLRHDMRRRCLELGMSCVEWESTRQADEATIVHVTPESATCRTISLSFDIWTSSNYLPILGIIGHWLTEDFSYQERALDFKELNGIHGGENLASAVQDLLVELGLEHKLIAITADNASNNERMVDIRQKVYWKSTAQNLGSGARRATSVVWHILST